MNHRLRPIKKIFKPLALAAWCVVSSVSALAQVVPNAGQLLQEQQRFERENSTRNQPQDLIQDAVPRAPIKLPEGMQIPVSRFRVTGNKTYSTEQLQALVQPWEGQSLDVNGLNDAAGAITRLYQNNGHLLAYAYLPQQKIEQGVVEIAVIEGMVDSVQIVTAQDVRLRDEAIQSYVGSLAQSPQVTQLDLERRLLLLNDIPGVVARASFAPGSKPGTADVIVSVAEEPPLAYSVDLNNQGSESTGEYRMGASFQLRNLFGLGDSTRLRLQMAPKAELVTGILSSRIPLGGDGWALDWSLSRLSYLLAPPYDTLVAYGDANSVHAGLSYQLIRGVDQNVTLSGGWDFKNLTDRNIGTNNQKNSQQLGLGVVTSSRDDWGGGGSLQTSLNLNFGTLTWVTPNANGGAEGAFTKINFDITRRQAISNDWSSMVHWQGQTSLDNLDSSEKFSLTGPYGVRAFASGMSSVDTGQVLSLELRKSYLLTGGQLYWSLFYDYAEGYFDMKPSTLADNKSVVRGQGIGLGWNTGGEWDASATLAWRSTPALAVSADRVPYLYFQLTKGF